MSARWARIERLRAFRGIAIAVLAVVAGTAALAEQDLPTDDQIQSAFGIGYDRLGLMEYCASQGFAGPADVANARRTVAAITGSMSVGAAAKAQEAFGRRGTIVGEQAVGLMDAGNPARPEVVPAGRTMSLADNARAQKTTERVLCSQMAAQMAPPP